MANSLGHYRDMIVVLAQKDFKVRYKNSVLGFLWALLNPLAYMAVLTFVFSTLFKVNIPNFAAWVLIGLLIWRFLSIATNQGLFSIVGNPSLVSGVHVPRHIIVLSNNVANFLGATLEFAVFLPVLVLLGVDPSIWLLLLPVILTSEFLLVFGISLSLSSLYVRYRDLHEIWDIALQLGFFLSPIVYDANIVPARYQLLYSLNPVTKLIESARSILLLGQPPSLFDTIVIVSSIAIFLLIGFLVFGRLERRFAEEL